MTEFKQTTSTQNQKIRQAILVGQNIGANNFLFIVLGIYLAITTGTWQAYGVIALAAEAVIGGFASAYLIKNGRVKQGAWLLLVTDMLAPALAAWIITDFSFVSIAYIAVSTYFIYTYAIPTETRRTALVTIFAALLVPVVAGFVDVPWKLTSTAMLTIAPILTTILGIAFLVVIIREAWSRNNIRSRFLTITLGLTLAASAIIAIISVSSLFSAGRQAQESSSQVLRTQAQETLRYQTVESALKNDLILENISQDAKDVAKQAAYIFENPNAFNSDAFWKADEHMFFGPNGEYINGPADVSTVFIPNTVEINNSVKQQLELLAYLDMALVPVYEGDPNSVAIYFVGTKEVSWLHPNINLGEIVSPDYIATQDIFYSIGSPENNPERQVVWTPVYEDPGGQGLLVSAIAPVYAGNKFMGVIGIDVSLASLTTNIETETFGTGEGTYAFLIDTAGGALALPKQGYKDFLGRESEPGEFGADLASSTRSEFTPIIDEMLAGSTGFQSVTADGRELFVSYTTLKSTGWHLASVVDAAEVLAPAAALQAGLENGSRVLVFQRILPVGVAIIVLVVFVGFLFTNRLVNPIETLTQGAEKIGNGEWDTPLPQSELVEISGLSHTLGAMAAQIKSVLGNLEERVAARTRNLQLAAEVGRAVSQVRDLDVMLKDASELILKEFNLYYVQVYLTDPSGSTLNLEAGTGIVGSQLVGRGHSLPLNVNSINGRAAVEKRAVVIPDTTKSASFRQNPLLPETRGEMAVPLIVANKVVGVLDMQSSQPSELTEEILPAFEALAGQLAVAIQNASLLVETEQARTQVEAQARRLVRQGWNEHLDAIHKPENIGFLFDHHQVISLADVEESQLPENENAITAPISVTGEPLGSLMVEIENESRREQTSELVNIVARQVAQQIENLRLLERAERYRYEAERVARLQTIEGWQKFIESRSGESLGYIYDTREVHPQSNGQDEDASMFTLPIKAHDEKIGKLAIQGLTNEDQESVDLVNAVAERLSAHIENLRLFEETRLGQVELDKRARRLATVAKISIASSRELELETMLKSVVTLTQREFGLYHTHVFVLDENTELLNIMACGWNEGDPREHLLHGDHPAIQYNQEKSLVARAARTKQAIIINDVHNETSWLPNPNLPDTVSEMAVPLVVGDRVLGVLDVQSEKINAFTEEDVNIYSTLASQVATALQNAYSFSQAQSAQAQSEKLFNAGRDLTQATDLQEMVNTAVTTLNIPAINRAILVAFDYDKSGNLAGLDVIANWWNGTGNQATEVGTHYSLEVIRVMSMFVSPTPVFFDDTFTDERVDSTTMQLVQRLNLRAVAVLPLHVGTTQLGALILEAEVPHNFSVEETRLFTAIAPQVATIVDNRRQFERAQKQAEREATLNIINQKIQSATSVEAVLQIAARELGHALGAPMTIAQLSMKDGAS